MSETYSITIRHHSIARARVERYTGTLPAAKRFATREFGAGFNDHEIVIYLGEDLVARRRIGADRWTP